jgi:hypothetical protein
MGLQRDVTFTGEPPAWQALRDRLAAARVSVAVRMIDNMPAFPDEAPEPGWRELRLGTPHGMVTLRRTPGGVSVMVWGNAEPALLRDCDLIVSTIADLTGGSATDVG